MEGNINLEKLGAQFPEMVLGETEYRGETTITVDPEQIVEICTYLRDDPDFKFDQLTFVSAVDNLARNGQTTDDHRFDAVYQLHSLTHRRRLRLKAPLKGNAPRIASVVPVWPAADTALLELVREEALDILHNHQPPPLPAGAEDKIEAILARADRALR